MPLMLAIEGRRSTSMDASIRAGVVEGVFGTCELDVATIPVPPVVVVRAGDGLLTIMVACIVLHRWAGAQKW